MRMKKSSSFSFSPAGYRVGGGWFSWSTSLPPFSKLPAKPQKKRVPITQETPKPLPLQDFHLINTATFRRNRQWRPVHFSVQCSMFDVRCSMFPNSLELQFPSSIFNAPLQVALQRPVVLPPRGAAKARGATTNCHRSDPRRADLCRAKGYFPPLTRATGLPGESRINPPDFCPSSKY
jgi:hypothetical protein